MKEKGRGGEENEMKWKEQPTILILDQTLLLLLFWGFWLMLLLFLVVDAVNVVGLNMLILGPIQPTTILILDKKLLLLL